MILIADSGSTKCHWILCDQKGSILKEEKTKKSQGECIICFENTWFSVISPEGCASILFRDSTKCVDAADSMKVTATDLFELGICDKR